MARTVIARPAALDGDDGIDRGQGRQQAGTAIHADHIKCLAGQTATKQIAQEALPFGCALRARQAEVDNLFLAVGPQPQRHQNWLPQRTAPVLRASTTPSSISTW
jgi:hypothetical protein